MPDIDLTITGLQEAMERNAERIAAMQPSGRFGEVIRDATVEGHRYVVAITHVDTGALRASHRMKVDDLTGSIYLDPGARNPRSGALTSVYGVEEHNRGGSHAFYTRTRVEEGPKIVKRARERLVKELVKS